METRDLAKSGLAVEQLRTEHLLSRKPHKLSVSRSAESKRPRILRLLGQRMSYLMSRLLDRLGLTLVGHEAYVWRADIILPVDA